MDFLPLSTDLLFIMTSVPFSLYLICVAKWKRYAGFPSEKCKEKVKLKLCYETSLGDLGRTWCSLFIHSLHSTHHISQSDLGVKTVEDFTNTFIYRKISAFCFRRLFKGFRMEAGKPLPLMIVITDCFPPISSERAAIDHWTRYNA